MIHAVFGEGPTSVGPLSRRQCVRALAPEANVSRPRRLFPQPAKCTEDYRLCSEDPAQEYSEH